MTERPQPEALRPDISDAELEWAAANLPRVRRWVSGHHFIGQALVSAFLLGLVAHVGGYVLTKVAAGEPLRLFADLFATLGTTVWTGVVLVVLVEVLPEARRRWAATRLEQYEAALRDQGRPSR